MKKTSILVLAALFSFTSFSISARASELGVAAGTVGGAAAGCAGGYVAGSAVVVAGWKRLSTNTAVNVINAACPVGAVVGAVGGAAYMYEGDNASQEVLDEPSQEESNE